MARRMAHLDSLLGLGPRVPARPGKAAPYGGALRGVEPYRDAASVPQERFPHRFLHRDHCVLCGRPLANIDGEPCSFSTGPGNDVGTWREREGNDA